MLKWLTWIILIVVLMSSVFADGTDSGFVNQKMQIWADIGSSGQFYPSDAANLTVYTPTGILIISNQAMQPVSMGIYVKNLTPNISGTFYTYTEFYSNNSRIATASSTFYIQPAKITESENMTGLGIIIAIGIALAIFSYMAFKFKSENGPTNTVWRIFSLIMVVLLLVLLAWTSISANQTCVFIATDATTTGYNYVCETGEAPQGSMFLKLMLLVLTIFFIWIFVSLFISSLEMFRKTGKL